MRIKWFLVGAIVASIFWALVITGLGQRWIYALFGVQ